ncbi:MAG: DUF2232 domain-containing protein [Candidatus Wallbacteria bacterium]|nr:DUF2232 domain-containing protein [Candidatus Wallbacteria bacterium]MBI4869048.1 DUF2232 domain-containing protein [Candidatus Wallbacteria bacterium]
MRLPPPGNRTAAVAESGLLSAVGCVLYLCWYNPVLNVLAVALTPMPLTLLAYRHGWRSGLAGLAVTAIGVSASIGPPDALIYIGLFGMVGFVTGSLLHGGLSPGRVLAVGSLLVTAYNMIDYYLLEKLFGMQDSMAPLRESAKVGLDWMFAGAPAGNEATAAAFRRAGEEFFVFPAALFFAVAAPAYIANYVLSLAAFRQLGIELKMPPGIHLFRLPPVAGAGCLALFACAVPAVTSVSQAARIGWVNAALMAIVLLLAEGWSLLLFVLDLTYARPPARLAALLAFMVLSPVAWMLGLADSLLDLRSHAIRHLG